MALLCLFSADSYIIYEPGKFNYNCSGAEDVRGQFSVVRGHYGIVLCRDCQQAEHTVQQGMVLYWSYGEENMRCSPVVEQPEGLQLEPRGEGGRPVCARTAWEQGRLHEASKGTVCRCSLW